jgi:hypothetical protein
MSYHEETRTEICPSCGVTNHVIIAYSGDYRANEREPVECFSCDKHLLTEKCFALYAGPTPEDAVLHLRRMQNRA